MLQKQPAAGGESCVAGFFYSNRKVHPMKQNAPRGSHCGGKESTSYETKRSAGILFYLGSHCHTGENGVIYQVGAEMGFCMIDEIKEDPDEYRSIGGRLKYGT